MFMYDTMSKLQKSPSSKRGFFVTWKNELKDINDIIIEL